MSVAASSETMAEKQVDADSSPQKCPKEESPQKEVDPYTSPPKEEKCGPSEDEVWESLWHKTEEEIEWEVMDAAFLAEFDRIEEIMKSSSVIKDSRVELNDLKKDNFSRGGKEDSEQSDNTVELPK